VEFALGYVLILLVLSSGPNRSATSSRPPALRLATRNQP
jgi:hypothetical protein